MPSVQAAHGLPSGPTISRLNSAASEVGMMAPDEAGLSHAAADAAAQSNGAVAADQGTAIAQEQHLPSKIAQGTRPGLAQVQSSGLHTDACMPAIFTHCC